MKIKNVTEEEFKSRMRLVLGKYLDLTKFKVFVFGSRVTERGDERSDIDVGIEGDGLVPEADMQKIKEEVEEMPLLYKVDVVDFRRVADDFYQVAKQRVEYI